MIKNTPEHFGLLSRAIHWLSAFLVIGLFALGLWMSGLSYYHEWYQTAPDLHRSFGVVLLLLTVVRVLWYQVSPKPKPLSHHSRKERMLAVATHHTLMALLLVMFVSGYLITTAKGDPVYVFDLFAIPSLINGIDNLEDYAGDVHEIAAYSIIGLAALHAAGALKHHFIDKDSTLKRMLGF
ncbi:MAG TPA: cytochrome b [Marinagarivorans sp.]